MNKKVLKSLLYDKKYIVLIIFVSTIFSMIFSAYLMFNESKYINKIQQAKNNYGNFHCAFLDITNDEFEIINKSLDIRSITKVPDENIKIKESIDMLSYLSKKDLKNTYYYVAEGEFPEKPEEIAVEK